MPLNSLLSHEIALWAFGDGFESETPACMLARWNRLHSDLFEIVGGNSIRKTEIRIIESYNQQAQNAGQGV